MATRFTDRTIVSALFALPTWQRARAIDQIIAHMDALDLATEDLEDDDPAGDPLDIHGEPPSDDGTPLLARGLLYDVDQTDGPTNWSVAYREWRMALLEPSR